MSTSDLNFTFARKTMIVELELLDGFFFLKKKIIVVGHRKLLSTFTEMAWYMIYTSKTRGKQ